MTWRNTFDVTVNAIYHDTATVTMHSPVYREYLHLIRTADGWRSSTPST